MLTLEALKAEQRIPVVIADHQGMITHINEPFAAVFGWRSDEIVGRSLTVMIPMNLRDAHQLGFSRFVTTGAPTLLNRPLILKALTKDGQEIEAEHVIIAEQRNGQWMLGATIRPTDGRVTA